MRENYYALMAAIINKRLTVDKALMAMGIRPKNSGYYRNHYHLHGTWGSTCFILHYVCGMSYSEISRKLTLDRKTVYRAIESFKRQQLI